MTKKPAWHENIVTPALLRHGLATYSLVMRRALERAGYDDIPRNGLYVLGGLGLATGDTPLANLIKDLRLSKQAAGQLMDTMVTRGYLQRTVDESDRRRLVITLTERGHAAADIQREARDRLDAMLEASVGAAHVATTRRTLAALIDIGHQDHDE